MNPVALGKAGLIACAAFAALLTVRQVSVSGAFALAVLMLGACLYALTSRTPR